MNRNTCCFSNGLDISLRTRVSDSLPVASGIGTADSLSLQNYQAEGGTNSLDQLNLVRVYLSVSGPADRLADNLVLRSSPPLSQDRLLDTFNTPIRLATD